MNFFAQQDKARGNTGKLVFLFALAVLSLIVVSWLLLIIIFTWSQGNADTTVNGLIQSVQQMDNNSFWLVSLTIPAIIFLAFLYKSAQLSSGGKAVAEAMDGRLINSLTRNADENKILNVVEEMALASGTPVPSVYIIEDHAINAFAAGHCISDAVIGVTRGCIQTMNRNELQGIVAHEFSHIFNGDMRLNIRLISALHGILVLGIIGHMILRTTSYGHYGRGYRRHHYRSSRNSKDAAPLMALGFGLMAIGYLGTFFGNLIKAAVSRQREFLADASAVQFTRNPDGIGNALKKIGGYSLGSLMQSSETDEISHLLFSQGITKSISGLFATHPPLEERIQRIDKSWNGQFPSVALPTEVIEDPDNIVVTPQGPRFETPASPVSSLAGAAVVATVLESVGEPSAAHVDQARALLNEIPEKIKQAAHEPYGARALVYSLLLDNQHKKIKQKQFQYLEQYADSAVLKLCIELSSLVDTLSIQCRLPLIDLCIPSLKQLGQEPLSTFKNNILALIKADNKIDLFEWALYRICIHHLEKSAPVRKHVSIKAVRKDCVNILSAVAISSSDDTLTAKSQMESACQILGIPLQSVSFNENILTDLSLLDKSLKRCNFIYPLKKPKFIKACFSCLVKTDDHESLELIRAIADGLDVPMPPLLPGQSFV